MLCDATTQWCNIEINMPHRIEYPNFVTSRNNKLIQIFSVFTLSHTQRHRQVTTVSAALNSNYPSQDAPEQPHFLPYQSRDDQLWLPSRSNGGASLTTKQSCTVPFIGRHKLDLRCRRSSL